MVLLDYFNLLLDFLASLGMFVFGMSVLATGLQKSTGNRMKRVLEVLTKKRVMGVLLGTAVTAVIQSSSATTVMVVGFVNAGVMNLAQSVGVIMGANIGTTVTSWIVSSVEWARFITPTTIAPLATVAGAFMLLFNERKSLKQIGEVIVGLGILFIGMTRMPEALKPLAELESVRKLFITMGANPLLGILAGLLVTGLIQSSSVSVGILQSLAMAGLVPWNTAVYIIMGQNIGTCVTALISSIGANRNARSAAFVHLLFNVIGTAVFGTLAILFFSFINRALGYEKITSTEISVVHTSFNVACTVMLFPLGDMLVRIASKIARTDTAQVSESETLHLDDRILNTPTFALQSCLKEIIRLGGIAYDNLKLATSSFMDRTDGDLERVYERENAIYSLEEAITGYLVKICSHDISEAENIRATSYFHTLSDLERIGDHAENIADLVRNYRELELSFSEAAAEELDNIIKTSLSCVKNAVEALAMTDAVLANAALSGEAAVDKMKDDYRDDHINRLQSGQCTIRSGIVFLEVLNNLERVTDHAKNIAETALKDKK
jgi:phosphate:Na+ symporter